MYSGLMRVARGGCGAKAPPLAARPGGKDAGLFDLLFSRGLDSTYLGGHDDFVIGPTQDRYYLAPDVHQKCEDLRSNQPLFLVLSVRH